MLGLGGLDKKPKEKVNVHDALGTEWRESSYPHRNRVFFFPGDALLFTLLFACSKRARPWPADHGTMPVRQAKTQRWWPKR